jgi:hypothetical protein
MIHTVKVILFEWKASPPLLLSCFLVPPFMHPFLPFHPTINHSQMRFIERMGRRVDGWMNDSLGFEYEKECVDVRPHDDKK